MIALHGFHKETHTSFRCVFFVLNPNVVDLIKDNQTSWEHEPLATLAKNEQLYAFKHDGFWQPMDTLREKNILNELWEENNAPWKIWK